MASRYEVEVTVTSAKDLKNVNWRHGRIKPYAAVWVDQDRKVTTRVDEEGDTCPCWDQRLIVPCDRPIEDATLHIDIVHAYATEDTKPLIGSAKLPLREVIDEVGMGRRATRQLKLKRPSGRPHGKLDLEIAVKDSRYRDPDAYYAPTYGVRDAAPNSVPYPAPSYGAPPAGYPGYAQPGYAQPSYTQPGYPLPGYAQPGYAQPSYAQPGYADPAYGYGPGPVEEKKKSKFGGMGTGLAVGAVAGALGGLALAEGFDKLEDHIADEAADRVEDDLADGNVDYYDGDDGGDGDW